MENTIAITRMMEVTGTKRLRRPRVRFLTPEQLAPFKEQVWEINAALVEWCKEEFEQDFDAAGRYAVFFSAGEVVGICTVMEQEFQIDGRRVFTIGLGRAVVQPQYRNQFLVQRALIFRWMRRFAMRPWQPIYIWGNCVSYKSYLSFVRVLSIVYPVAEVSTPERHSQVIDAIGEHWYGEAYDAGRKLVRVPNFRVSDETTRPNVQDLLKPDIRFYCDQVPVAEDATFGLLTISPCIRSNFLPMVGSWIRNIVRKSLGIRRKF